MNRMPPVWERHKEACKISSMNVTCPKKHTQNPQNKPQTACSSEECGECLPVLTCLRASLKSCSVLAISSRSLASASASCSALRCTSSPALGASEATTCESVCVRVQNLCLKGAKLKWPNLCAFYIVELRQNGSLLRWKLT